MHLLISAAAGEHLLLNFFIFSHPRAQNVSNLIVCLQVLKIARTDHVPVGNDTKPLDIETLPHLFTDRLQSADTGGVTLILNTFFGR